MNRRAILLLLILVASVSRAEDGVLTTAHIPDSMWEWHAPNDLEDWPKYCLRFWEDGSVSEENKYSGQMDSELFAKWEVISPRQMLLRYVECVGNDPPPEEYGEIAFSTAAKGEIRRLEDSVYHEYAIYLSDWGDSPSLVLLSEDFTVRPNLRRTLKGVEVITMGAVSGMTTQNVRTRTAPRVTASIIRFSALDYCPKGRYIRVLARTLEKKRVQKWINYWYYVEITAGQGMQRYGWMFGEFLTFSEDEVREEETAPRPWDYHAEEDSGSPEGEEADPALYEYD